MSSPTGPAEQLAGGSLPRSTSSGYCSESFDGDVVRVCGVGEVGGCDCFCACKASLTFINSLQGHDLYLFILRTTPGDGYYHGERN